MKRVLSLRVLFATLLAIAVIGPAFYAWRWYQVRREAGVLLERAESFAADRDWPSAADCYHLYLELRPDDSTARIRRAQVFDESVTSKSAASRRRMPRAIEFYYQALATADEAERPPLRLRVAELQLKVGQFALAVDEVGKLEAEPAKDPRARRVLALARYGLSVTGALDNNPKALAEVGRAFEEACAANPADPEIASILADIYRRQTRLIARFAGPSDPRPAPAAAKPEKPEKAERKLTDFQERLLGKSAVGQTTDLTEAQRVQLADAVMDQMVSANSKSSEAYEARFVYRAKYELPRAEDDLASALKCATKDEKANVILRAAGYARHQAERSRQAGKPASESARFLAEAQKYYQQAIDAAPTDERGYIGLGDVLAAQNNTDEALKMWRLGLEKSSTDSPELNSRIGEALIAKADLPGAEEPIKRLEAVLERTAGTGSLSPGAYRFLKRQATLLRAELLARKGDRYPAVALAKGLVANPPASPDETTQALKAWLLLGDTHSGLGEWDQAAIAYDQLSSLRPRWAIPRELAARAWLALGRPEVAGQRCEQALAIQNSLSTSLLLAEARLQVQAALPAASRDWRPFSQAMANATKLAEAGATGDAWLLDVLNARRAALDSGNSDAQKKAAEGLRAAEKQHPDSANLYRDLVFAYESLAQASDADRALATFERLSKTSWEGYLLRARLYAARKQPGPARQALEAGVKSLPRKAILPLVLAMAQMSLGEGKLDQARQELLKAQELDPGNPNIIRRLADLAIDGKDFPAAERWEAKLKEMEGDDGTCWRYSRARRLAQQAKDEKDPLLSEAADLQAAVQQRRAAWPPAHLLRAEIAWGQRNLQGAADAYQEALRLGEQRVTVVERLGYLLTQLGRPADVERYLAPLQDQVPGSSRLSSLEVYSELQLGQLDRALETARLGAQSRPNDPVAQIMLGQMLLANRKQPEAEAAFRKAVELAPEEGRGYKALFGFYLQTRQPEKARQTLQELAGRAKLADADRALLLAEAYEALNDRKAAEAKFREAERLAPKSAAVQERLAGFLSGTDPDAAEKALRRAVELEPQSPRLRQKLAAHLAARGGEPQWQEAMRLLEGAGGPGNVADLDRRLQALLLVGRGGKENTAKAREILEQIVADPQKAGPGDRLRLAQVCELSGSIGAANQHYLTVVNRSEVAAAHLAAYVDFLLRQEGMRKNAPPWMDKLDKLAPNDITTVGLRARWLDLEGRKSEIGPLVKTAAEALKQKIGDDKQRQAQLCLAVGALYRSVKDYDGEQRWCRQLKDLLPERYEPLAAALAHQGRLDEAMSLCLEAAKSDTSARPAVTLAMVLTAGRPTDRQFEKAEPLFSKAIQAQKDDMTLLNAVANVRIVQNRMDEAVRLLKRVIQSQPKDVLALNNLASILGEQPGMSDEALRYVDQAIAIVGQQPGLLDTKGMILFYSGRAKEAAELLETAVSTPRADARYFFHLAAAYDRLGEKKKASEAFSRAQAADLTSQLLTEMDKKLLADLSKRL